MFLAVGAGDIVGGTLPPGVPRLLQGPALSGRRRRHPGPGRGAQHLPHGQPAPAPAPVYWLFLIGAVSLSAFPLLGGFFSKDRILLATFIHPGHLLQNLLVYRLVAAFLTPLYTFRVFFVAFPERPDGRRAEDDPAHSPHSWPGYCGPWRSGPGRRPVEPAGRHWQEFSGTLSGHRPRGPARPGGIPGHWSGPWGSSAPPWCWSLSLLAYLLYYRRPAREPALVGYWRQLLFSGFYLDQAVSVDLRPALSSRGRILWRQVDDR